MEQAQGTEQVSTEATATETQSQPAETTNITTETPQVSTGEVTNEPSAAPAYKPDLKFWAEQKEHEVPEWLRDKIKDAESEKQVKELLQKAYGLDGVKAVREQIKAEARQYKEQAEPVIKTVHQASQSFHRAQEAWRQKNIPSAVFNMEATFQTLGIPEQAVQQYVLQKLKIADADPAVKDAYTRHRDIESQYLTQQSQLQQVQTQYQQVMVQQRTYELNQALSKPEVMSVVQSFDQRNGQGSFEAEVIRQGQLHYQLTGKDLPAEEVVKTIIQRYGFQANQPVQQQTQQTSALTPRELPVIPVAKGGGKSPAGQSIQSTEDMRKAYKQITNQI